MTNKQKTIFSGIQPSGKLNIANYIGAISQWSKLQDEYKCIFSIVDYHAITVDQNPELLRKQIREVAKIYVASGIDPKKSIIFQQSTISAHTELTWIFNCYGARIADLNKMTQFKDKAEKNQESASVGLFDYPVLMAADILLYNTDIVPVGEDQKQHVELTRDIAKRFNNKFERIFKIPEAVIKKEGARVMSLLSPDKKMSKSDLNQNNAIALLDDPEIARKKIMKAVTDSGSGIFYDPLEKPALSNLLTIYAQLGNRNISRLERDYKDKGYGDFKKDLADVVAKFLEEFQAKYYSIKDSEIENILKEGSIRAQAIANSKLSEIKKIIGVG